ncbi:replication fork protection component Swi3-domain-containing protein [Phellopilus nigrolimitatus]|nr:replication fork protection component Swi3-domain-containing protein [Phellopilus nigrolimitatus]
MSVSLDDIWSESLENSPSPPRREAVAGGADDDEEDSVFRPSKRRRSTLFLEDPDEGDEESTSLAKSAQGPGNAVPDISSLFDDLEEPAPAASTSKPFDLAAVRREAQRRAEKEAPASSFPKYAVQSSSPPRDGMDGEGKENAFGAHKGGDGGKEKRPIAKLDETRILGKDGLPALVQLCKDFKPKGKGHELSDLNRLFSVYQFWAHKMYPKITFSDTVNRVEKLCHSKRMHVSLSVWRDEAKGKIDGKDEDVEMRSDKGEESGDDDDVFGPRREMLSLREYHPPVHHQKSSSLRCRAHLVLLQTTIFPWTTTILSTWMRF